MASRKRPSRIVPATEDPNAPDVNFEEDVNLPDEPAPGDDTGGFSVFYQQKFDEAFAALRAMPLKKRLAVQKFLYSRGFGSDSEPSVDGLSEVDIDRYRDVLVSAFVAGRSPATYINNDITKLFPAVRQVGAGTERTPVPDVDRVFEDVVRVQLGRGPRREEKEKFRAAYSALEAGGNAPTLASAAQQQVETGNTAEQQATRFSGFVSQFEQMLRGA